MAESLTDKLKLSKRDTGDINWGQGANANLDAVDAHAQQATLRPPRTLSASLGSGAVGVNLSGSATYFYKITAVNAVGETTEGKIPTVLEAQVTESASPVPVLLSWETVKGATGYKIYKSTVSGQEKFLASVSGESTAIYTDDGNTATNGGISVPAANTARTSVSKIIAGTNVTISPTDGTGDVTVNATSSAPSDASDTVKGVTKLSLAPAVAANPIAVGDNDSRNSNARTPTGAAGGDLSGTYPNPAVAKVNGTSVPATPSAGQVLTATGPTAATWQAPASSYAATVVVAAPSGNAATDTTNVTTALTAAASAGGGKVLLREGTYLINSALTIGANVILMGQGKSATVVQATTSVGATPFIALTASRGSLRDLTVDFNTSARGRIAAFDMNITGANVVVDSVALINNAASNLTRMIKIQPTTAAQFVTFSRCDITFGDGTTLFSMAQVQFAVFDSCFFNMLSKGNSQVWFEDISGSGFLVINSCTFSINIGVAQTSLVQWGGSSTGPLIFTNNKIDILSGSITNTVQVLSASTIVTVSDNTAVSTSAGGIVGLAKTTVCGNNGFSSYSGGIQAGNDLGTINAVLVSTTAPTTGQVLTATGAAAASWQTPAGGGGYATVVVAAPTGVAATDTANIQNAINGIGNGTVILREGLYVVNATIALKDRITIRGQGKGEFGSGAPTTIKCDNAMGDIPLFDDGASAKKDVSLEDFSIDFNGFTRAARSGNYDIRLLGVRARLLRIALANTSGINTPILIQCNNITEFDSPLVAECIFIQGKVCANQAFSITGKVMNCTFIGNTATGGFQSGLARFGQPSVVTGCVFRTSVDYTTGVSGSTVSCNTAASNGRAGSAITGCMFIQESGSATRALQVENDGTGAVAIAGNFSATGTNVGSVSVRNGGGSGKVTISGNAGFASYNGGTLSGNDGQTPVNSGDAAGGDLSGTYPNPTVAKVNGVSVPAAPSAGQVLTATGATAATWQAPASGGYATVVVAAPTGVAATDTANIQAALNSIPVASGGGGGGVVILRQGIYVVNQITIFNEGTKLTGSGPGFTTNRDSSPGSSLQAANPLSADMLVILASQVMVENISFKGFGLAVGFALVSGNMGNTVFRDCAFVDIKSGNIGIKATTGQKLKILDCMFQLDESAAQTVARTPICIKVGAAGGGFSQSVDIIGNHFMLSTAAPTGAGSVTGKAIEMTKVFKAVIERNQIEGVSGAVVAGVTMIGVELFTDGSASAKGVVIGNNSGRRLNNFIRQATAFPKVSVAGNNYIDHVGTAPVVDLVSGNTNWAISGNVIEGATGVNLAAGADSNVVADNIANVTNAGAGNSVVNNVAPI